MSNPTKQPRAGETRKRRKPPVKSTSVGLEAEVREYLDQLAERHARSRSWLVNAIVLEHRRRNESEESPLFNRPLSPTT